MSYSSDISAAVASLDRWQSVALAGMCASSMSPVVEYFARPAVRSVFERGMQAVWKSVIEGNVDSEVVFTQTLIKELPESVCDDSNIPDYEVMVALGVLSYTLDAVVSNDHRGACAHACTLAANHFGYDRPRLYENISETTGDSPVGRLKPLLIRSQFRSLELLRGHPLLSTIIVDKIRKLGDEAASELNVVLPMYAMSRGWGV